MKSIVLSRKESYMNCTEFLAEPSRCKRGIPVARLFRHYFCEGDHNGCPLKGMEKMGKGRAVKWPENSLLTKVKV
jgi:hypothetical protein